MRLSQSDRVLVAAYQLDLLEMDRAIGLPDLAVKCWQLWPEAFSMEGHNHPDPHKVRCALYAVLSSCTTAKKCMRLIGRTTWTITETGRTHARKLTQGMKPPPGKPGPKPKQLVHVGNPFDDVNFPSHF